MASAITREGFDRLAAELRRLKEERPAIARAIGAAREHGDLRENAEYHAAKEKQGLAEARIRQLEGILGEAQVVDPSRRPSGKVGFGAHVTVVDLENDKEVTYRIVGEHEADVERGLISLASPLARALMGREEGDGVEFQTPRGVRELEVTGIRY